MHSESPYDTHSGNNARLHVKVTIQANHTTMKRLVYILALIFSLTTALPSFAVTEKEMDQARAIAAHSYLRYANDGSGYLDDIKPTSMAVLEKALKAKEKENIQAFKAIPVPKDYPSWDKQKLVEYWGVSAFASKGLIEKGRIGKSRAKKRINAMKIEAPAKQEKAQDKKAEAAPVSTPAATETESKDASKPQKADITAIQSDSLTKASAADPLSDPLFNELDTEPQITKAKDHTWVYIIILCVLVAVVVALVVFASNVMKRNSQTQETAPMPQTPRHDPTESVEGNAMREKFAATLAAKNEEISSLSKKVEYLNNQNNTLKSNLEGLTAEVSSLRLRLTETTNKLKGYEASAAQPAKTPTRPSVAPKPVPSQTASQPTAVEQPSVKPANPSLRSIFLGRANGKGIFVRADRTLNPGNSIFRLDTTDGYAGSFRVVSNPIVWEMAMLTPVESLAGACAAPNITDTDGMTKIVNDSAGTAIFEGGCWKVIRKAKIHFE